MHILLHLVYIIFRAVILAVTVSECYIASYLDCPQERTRETAQCPVDHQNDWPLHFHLQSF